MDAYHEALVLVQKEMVSRMEYLLDRANQCIDQLSNDHIWHRPNDKSNAIGNLILHIVGSLKLMILSGISGLPDTRNRSAEFEAKSIVAKEEIRRTLNETIESCCNVINDLSLKRVTEKANIKNADMTIGKVLVMAVSHTSMHVGQIQYAAKVLLQDAYREATNQTKSR